MSDFKTEHHLDIKPLSVNKAYKTVIKYKFVKGKKIPYPVRQKSRDYISWKKHFMLIIKQYRFPLFLHEDHIAMNIEFGFSSEQSDLSNPVKAFEDCLMEHLGLNDKNVFEINLRKKMVPKGSDYIKFKITKIIGE